MGAGDSLGERFGESRGALRGFRGPRLALRGAFGGPWGGLRESWGGLGRDLGRLGGFLGGSWGAAGPTGSSYRAPIEPP